MIKYTPFWETIKRKNISTYYLVNDWGFSSSTIQRLRDNKGITTTIINDLCNVLECEVSDIMVHIQDKKPYKRKQK